MKKYSISSAIIILLLNEFYNKNLRKFNSTIPFLYLKQQQQNCKPG